MVQSVVVALQSRICLVDGCANQTHALGLCGTHYQRFKRHGDPTILLQPKVFGTLEQRLWARVQKTDNCWLWLGRTNRGGYGVIDIATGRSCLAHRVAYELVRGAIDPGFALHHTCLMPNCVNPDHLEPIVPEVHTRTNPNNILIAKAQATQCIAGHVFDEANTYITRRGRRHCRICKRRRDREYGAQSGK